MAKKSKQNFSTNQPSLFEPVIAAEPESQPSSESSTKIASAVEPSPICCPRCGMKNVGRSVREPGKYYCQAGCTDGNGDNFYFDAEVAQ